MHQLEAELSNMKVSIMHHQIEVMGDIITRILVKITKKVKGITICSIQKKRRNAGCIIICQDTVNEIKRKNHK